MKYNLTCNIFGMSCGVVASYNTDLKSFAAFAVKQAINIPYAKWKLDTLMAMTDECI